MARVLLVFRGTISPRSILELWGTQDHEPVERAVCYELPPGQNSFKDALRAQRTVTHALRQVCGAEAENVPIFAVSDREGERVEDYAQAWGATVVRP